MRLQFALNAVIGAYCRLILNPRGLEGRDGGVRQGGHRGSMSPERGGNANAPGQIERISKVVDKIFAMA